MPGPCSFQSNQRAAIAIAGLLIGNQGRAFAMSDKTREHVDTFWELIEGILNVILFMLIGLAGR